MKTNRVICSVIAVTAMALSTGAQTLTEVYLPLYAANGNDTAGRLQTAARFSITGLTPNATYRYYVSGWLPTDGATDNGAGNYFGINNTANAAGYIQGYTSQKGLGGSLLANNEFASQNRYSEFTTDSAGSYTGWFALVPTSNPRFAAGNSIQMGVVLNNGAGGTSIAARLRSTTTLLMLGPTNTDAYAATMIIGDSLGAPGETMVLLYDNVAGSSRPIWATWVESDGITTTFSLSETNATEGRWAAYVPNSLANGIRRVEYWDIGSNTLLGVATDDDGIWPSLSGPLFAAANGDTTFDGNFSNLIGIIAPIPEPSALTLLGLCGLAALALRPRTK